MSLYEDLGVSPDADEATIKKAYRTQASKTHPDRATGSVESFQRIALAYAVLSDASRRKRYDDTGKTMNDDRAGQAKGAIASMLNELLDQADVDHHDLVGMMKKIVGERMQASRSEIERLRANIGKRQRALKRIRYKGPGRNMLADLLTGNIRHHEQAIAQLEEDIGLGDLTIKILDEYGYTVEAVLSPTMYVGSILT